MFERRDFLKASTAMIAAGLFAKASFSQESATVKTQGNKHSVRIGAPTFFPDDDPVAWAKNAREQRYRAVYAPNVSLDDKDRIKAVRSAVAENDLMIAEVGRWCNLMDADAEKRKENLKAVTEGLALADELDAKCCVDIAGSFDTESWFGPHPKNLSPEYFDLAVENARKIIDTVKPKRAKFAYEIMGWAIPDNPENYLKLIKAIDRPGFGAHIDVCNMINSPEKFWNTTHLINETFDLLGPWIVSCHAKDLKWVTELNIHFQECPLGEGTMDYPTLLRRLATLDHDAPLMIEHMKDQEEYLKGRDFLIETAAQSQVALELV